MSDSDCLCLSAQTHFFLSGEAVCLGRVGLERVTGSGSYWAKKVKRRLYCGGPKHGNETVRSSNLFFFLVGTTAHANINRRGRGDYMEVA